MRMHWTKLWRDCRGQDLIEYALLVGFVAVSVGIIFPASLYESYATIWGRVMCVLSTIGHSGV
jgi:Flp pilus assembly pilin Flp